MVIKTFNKQGLNAQPAEITTASLAAAEFLLPTVTPYHTPPTTLPDAPTHPPPGHQPTKP